MIKVANNQEETYNSVITIFPELKESEDERIRKSIYALITNQEQGSFGLECNHGATWKEMLAWLEKQKPIEPIDLKTWKYVVDAVLTEREGIGQYIDSPWTKEMAEKLQKRFGDIEQKPAEWSEEDKTILCDIIDKLRRFQMTVIGSESERCNEIISWLKSLRPQKKQGWSKEDIEMIDWLIRCCESEHSDLCNDRYGHQEIVSDLKRDCRKKWDWLESLKEKVAPQKQWKPSEEQLKSLQEVIDAGHFTSYPNALETLYEQLKKL